MATKSLSELCLDVIVGSFGRFNFAFVHTDDDNLKRNFEFLQKCYADNILRRLAAVSDGKIKKEYFALAINKYLKTFSTSLIPGLTWRTLKKILSEIGNGLEQLLFRNSISSYSFDVGMLRHLKNLRVLSMPSICDDDILINIVKWCPHLAVLDIRNSLVTDEGIKHLCQNNGQEVVNEVLQGLNIENIYVNDTVIPFLLLNLPSLELLLCARLPEILYSIHKRSVNESTPSEIKKYKLKMLKGSFLKEFEFFDSDVLKLCSEICPDVERLEFRINQPELLDLCALFSKLTKVVLKWESFSRGPIDINNFLKLKGEHIAVLNLSGFSLSVVDLSNNCKSLNSLVLKDIVFQSFTADSIKEFKHLKELTLFGTNFNHTFATISTSAILSSDSKLESLNFVSCKEFNPELKTEILKCCSQTSLKVITFEGSNVDMPLLQSVLTTTKTLFKLRVIECESISDYDFDVLKNMVNEMKNKPKIDYTSYYPDYDYGGTSSYDADFVDHSD